MLSIHQQALADLLNGGQAGMELNGLSLDKVVNDNLLVFFGMGSHKLIVFGSIFGCYPVDPHLSVFLYRGDLLCTPKHTFVPLRKKSLRSLVQVNVEYGMWGDETTSRWQMEANVPFAPFNIFQDNTLFCTGLVLDLGNLK